MKIDKSYPNLNLFLIEFIIGVIIIWTQPRDKYEKSAGIHKIQMGGGIILSTIHWHLYVVSVQQNQDIRPQSL